MRSRVQGGSQAVLVHETACAGPNRAGQTAAAWNPWKTPFPATRQPARPPIMRSGPPTDAALPDSDAQPAKKRHALRRRPGPVRDRPGNDYVVQARRGESLTGLTVDRPAEMTS